MSKPVSDPKEGKMNASWFLSAQFTRFRPRLSSFHQADKFCWTAKTSSWFLMEMMSISHAGLFSSSQYLSSSSSSSFFFLMKFIVKLVSIQHPVLMPTGALLNTHHPPTPPSHPPSALSLTVRFKRQPEHWPFDCYIRGPLRELAYLYKNPLTSRFLKHFPNCRSLFSVEGCWTPAW